MIALAGNWGKDLAVGPTGDIAVVSVQADIQRRIIRRLLTNPGDYIWHSDYGAGVGSFVGQALTPEFIESTILHHIRYESLVTLHPLPKVVSGESAGEFSFGTTVTIQFQSTDATAGNSATFELIV